MTKKEFAELLELQRISTWEMDRLSFFVTSLMNPIDRHCAITSKMEFSGLLRDELWTVKRINKLLALYGTEWEGKKILDLGAGYGDIGALFAELGAEVLCVEGRIENINIGKLKYRNIPRLTHMQRDLDGDVGKYDTKFDLLIHFGLLYHIENVEQNLRSCAGLSDEIILDTEVVDSLNDGRIYTFDEEERFWGNSMHGIGSRPSETFIQRIFEECGYNVEILKDPRLNHHFRTYDWENKGTEELVPGHRRFFKISR